MKQTSLPITSTALFHPNEPSDNAGGQNLLQAIDCGANHEKRKTHPYYPFANRLEWELGAWLMNGGLSMREIDLFLQLDFVSAFSDFMHILQFINN